MIETRSIVIAHYRPDIVSGAENSIADLVDQLDQRFNITMLIPGESKLAAFYRKRGFQVWIKRVETSRRMYPGLHTIQSWMLARELTSRGVDAVIANTFAAASRVATASRYAHLPFAIYMRDYTPDTSLHRKVLSQADALLAISNDVIQQHSAMARPGQFHLAYNFINPEPTLQRYQKHQASGKRLLPFGPEHPVVGLVGRLTPYKQPHLFLQAIPLVLEQVPEARFIVAGSAQEREKDYEESLHRLAAELGIEDQTIFLGNRTDAVEITSELTIACLASGREPLGRVVLEANLLGVPVVVPDSGGPAEIIEDEVTGLHFSSLAKDANQQMARQIVRLLKDPDLRSCLIEKGREHVLSTFANRKHVEIQEGYFDELCTARVHAS